MSLPDLIEIVPLEKPVKAEITVPGSKSITNRALVLAALADGVTILKGALWSEDTQVMVEALHTLGFEVKVENDPEEFCNRTITVKGLGGRIPKSGTAEKPLEIFVGNAGTAARFLAAMVCLGNGVYRLHGVPRMHERPQAALFKALRELGYRVETPNDKLPAVIFGQGSGIADCRLPVADLKGKNGDAVDQPSQSYGPAGRVLTKRVCTVSIEESSQFASALLLGAKLGGWEIKITGENAEESPYVAMTSKLIEAFPKKGGTFQIEPDASSGSYFWAAGAGPLWMDRKTILIDIQSYKIPIQALPFDSVSVAKWPKSDFQIDQTFPFHFGPLLLGLNENEMGEFLREIFHFKGYISRRDSLGDSIMTAIVLAPFASAPCKFTDLGRLRLQETERVAALRAELTKCGAKVEEEGDTLTVYPSKLHGATIETYNDHRMAMCFAILGLKVPGIKIQNPACVKKTFPNFFQKLATAPPHGLGVEIRDGTGRKLRMDELFAD